LSALCVVLCGTALGRGPCTLPLLFFTALRPGLCVSLMLDRWSVAGVGDVFPLAVPSPSDVPTATVVPQGFSTFRAFRAERLGHVTVTVSMLVRCGVVRRCRVPAPSHCCARPVPSWLWLCARLTAGSECACSCVFVSGSVRGGYRLCHRGGVSQVSAGGPAVGAPDGCPRRPAGHTDRCRATQRYTGLCAHSGYPGVHRGRGRAAGVVHALDGGGTCLGHGLEERLRGGGGGGGRVAFFCGPCFGLRFFSRSREVARVLLFGCSCWES
jgi:hypothetical protein